MPYYFISIVKSQITRSFIPFYDDIVISEVELKCVWLYKSGIIDRLSANKKPRGVEKSLNLNAIYVVFSALITGFKIKLVFYVFANTKSLN